MAIWQFDLAFIPRAADARVACDRGTGCLALPHSLAPQVHAWLCLRMGSPFPLSQGWLVFGAERGDRVDLRYSLHGGSKLRARVDARSGGASHFCGEVCRLADLLNCEFFSAELGRRIEPTPCALKEAMKGSSAAAFLSDPESFLEKLFLRRFIHGGRPAALKMR